MITIEYLAGFFDGEGTIRVKKRVNQSDHLQLQIGQKDEAVLLAIKDTFGGWIEGGGTVGVRRWVITGKKAKKIALAMLPFLIVKADSVRAKIGV